MSLYWLPCLDDKGRLKMLVGGPRCRPGEDGGTATPKLLEYTTGPEYLSGAAGNVQILLHKSLLVTSNLHFSLQLAAYLLIPANLVYCHVFTWAAGLIMCPIYLLHRLLAASVSLPSASAIRCLDLSHHSLQRSARSYDAAPAYRISVFISTVPLILDISNLDG